MAKDKSGDGLSRFLKPAKEEELPDLLDPNWSERIELSKLDDDTVEPRKWSKPPVWIWPVVASVIVAIAIAVRLATPQDAVIPTSFVPYSSPDKLFKCDAPSGWSQVLPIKYRDKDPSDDTPGGVKFVSGSGQINISIDKFDNLLAKDLLSTGDSGPTGSRHDRMKVLEQRTQPTGMMNLEEENGRIIASHLGVFGVSAEWTSDGDLFRVPTKTRGTHTSLIVGSQTFVVICRCNETQWKDLKPVFDTVLASMAPDDGLREELKKD